MIRGAHMPVGFQLPVARVAFQQRNRGFPFDDIVAFTAVSQEAKCIQIQVKENINLTGADPRFIELMAAAAQVCRQHPEELQKGDLRLALAAGGPAQDLKELSDLADKAVGQLSPAGLAELLVEGAVSSKIRNRYQHVVRAVTATGMATSKTMAEVPERGENHARLSVEIKYGAQRDVDLHELVRVQAACDVAKALRVDCGSLLD
jgi:hypothetical protein